ncbi:hypothetical protein [uncultured Erythrobacter sp.]|uniref:hypothetical protein n=1 Tax=uncultured Erythrobacter sp. TaxID=263913 RepID=UPI0026256B45|nr:hypothetical protein [uncultured Erythrobacter sp.]
MTLRDANGWQLILADLSLILFLVTIAALAEQTGEEDAETPASDARREAVNESEQAEERSSTTIAPAQALFRQTNGGPTISQWLAQQSIDPRATLSVIATHGAGEEQQVWSAAKALADQAKTGSGVNVRIVIQPGEGQDLYASLAYDAPQ